MDGKSTNSLKWTAVSEAAIKKWPGNEMPVFKKDSVAKKGLEKLVEDIADECSFDPACGI